MVLVKAPIRSRSSDRLVRVSGRNWVDRSAARHGASHTIGVRPSPGSKDLSIMRVTPEIQAADMSRIVPVKLVADRKATDDLVATLRACNAAANHVSGVAWERSIFRNFSLRAVTYGDVRSTFGLGAQAAQHTIKKVADAYNSGNPEYRRSRHRAFRWQSPSHSTPGTCRSTLPTGR